MIEQHVKELIEENFDPKKADTIFSEEGDISEYCFVFTVVTGLDSQQQGQGCFKSVLWM